MEGDGMTVHEKLDTLLERVEPIELKTQSITLKPTSCSSVGYFNVTFNFDELEDIVGITNFYSSNTLVGAPVDFTFSGNMVVMRLYGAHSTVFDLRVDAIGY